MGRLKSFQHGPVKDLRVATADAARINRSAKSKPLRVKRRTPAASYWAMMRKPSCFISWIHPAPAGWRLRQARQAGLKLNGSIGADPAPCHALLTSRAGIGASQRELSPYFKWHSSNTESKTLRSAATMAARSSAPCASTTGTELLWVFVIQIISHFERILQAKIDTCAMLARDREFISFTIPNAIAAFGLRSHRVPSRLWTFTFVHAHCE